MEIKSERKKNAIALIIVTLVFGMCYNIFINSIDKGETWRIVCSAIPTLMFGTFAIILFFKLRKLNK